MQRLVSTIAPCCTSSPRLLRLRSPLSHHRLHSLPSSSSALQSSPLASISLSPSLMPRNKKKDRQQHWKVNSDTIQSSPAVTDDASDTAAAESITNTLGGMSVVGSGHSVPAAHLQNVERQHHSLMPSQREVWKPKSYGTVSGSTDYLIGLGTQLEAETVKKDVASANENQDATLSELFTGKLLENFTVDNSTYSEAQIRATFYPKFENEKSDQEIRLRMIEMVSKGLCTVEVSLKHSGSLFMYAGHYGGAYAKNSYGNIYTAVGVFVLGRIFKEAWGPEANKKQAEFNLFLEKNRMCISMELVTAVLGDHGQRPREDYVVVTAVTELGNQKPRFYSTPEIIVFCRKWRLPTNHIWLFSTRNSVTSFFTAYDALCEEGTATPVCSALDEVADISIPGSKDHVKVQGEILEGLVARVVSRESSKHMEDILRDYPPPPPPQVEGVSKDRQVDLLDDAIGVKVMWLQNNIAFAGFDLGSSVRDICAANRSGEEQQIKALLESVGSSFCPDTVDWFGKRSSESHSRNADKSVVTKFLQSHPADFATEKLQEMIRLMKERRFPAAFKCYPNMHKLDASSNDELYYKMVIHVRSDSAFRRYQKEMRNNPELWPLYRGFFVDINLFKENKERAARIKKNGNGSLEHGNGSNPTSDANALADEDANLMIKLKFLTYKLRTFLIRNGLPILFKEGPAAYKVYYTRQMKSWGTSAAKQKEMSKMLDEWAVYIRRKCGNEQLKSDTYLTEAEPFLQQYAKRSATNQVLIGSVESSVRSEDFLAIVGGFDEEGDLERESKFASPSSPIPTTKDTIAKNEGLIVFFPGIPGCAKSALCKELLNNPDLIGDDRPIETLMGDLIKGKYWQKIAEARRKKPYSIMLADKNAPNEEVWRQIEDMCRKNKSSAVPVVPDSEGTDSNPFSLDALAIFILRVLQRVNHPGNLDKSSPNAGYVLIMFYHLYEGKNRREFEGELIDRFGSLVKMPLLRSDRNPLPDAVKSVLEEGINLYGLHTNRHGRRLDSTKGTYVKEWANWEKKLRDTLFDHTDYLNGIQVPFEIAVSEVRGQLKSISEGDYVAPSTERRKEGSIVYAAATLPVDEILSAFSNIEGSNSRVKALMKEGNLRETLHERSLHVTLAHKGSHGVAAVAKYGQFVKQKVAVELTALLFSDKTAAFEARLGSVEAQKVDSKNEWPHVTVWTNGVAAKEANNLPYLHSQGNATRVEIDPPIVIQGEVDLF